MVLDYKEEQKYDSSWLIYSPWSLLKKKSKNMIVPGYIFHGF